MSEFFTTTNGTKRPYTQDEIDASFEAVHAENRADALEAYRAAFQECAGDVAASHNAALAAVWPPGRKMTPRDWDDLEFCYQAIEAEVAANANTI